MNTCLEKYVPSGGRAALLLAAALALGPVAATAGATEPASGSSRGGASSSSGSLEDVYATVEPSVVQLGILWSGFVGLESPEGMIWSEELEGGSYCSGFFVSPSGHIATAGHCVDPAVGRERLINVYLDTLVEDGTLTAAEAEETYASSANSFRVEGFDDGSPIEREVYVGQPKAVDGAVVSDPVMAQVVDFRPFDEGDIALLKVEAGETPALPLAEQDPRSGAAVTAIGFPGSVSDFTDPTRVRASFKSGTVSNQQVRDGVAVTEVNADIGKGMSGGPTIDQYGNALGINSAGVDTDGNFNFITDTSDMREYLGARGISLASPRSAPEAAATSEPAAAATALPAGDGRSSGMPGWAWGVIAGVLLLAGLLGMLLMKRRTPATPHAGHGGSGQGPWSAPQQRQPYEGAPAAAVCANEHQNPLGAAYCNQCGAPVARQGAHEVT